MTKFSCTNFKLDDIIVRPDLDHVHGADGIYEVEPKAMAVLQYLATRPGEVISTDELIEHIWSDQPMSENPVYRCISLLRKALRDDAHHPRFIATIPKKGYRLLVTPVPMDIVPLYTSKYHHTRRLLFGLAIMLVIIGLGMLSALGTFGAFGVLGTKGG